MDWPLLEQLWTFERGNHLVQSGEAKSKLLSANTSTQKNIYLSSIQKSSHLASYKTCFNWIPDLIILMLRKWFIPLSLLPVLYSLSTPFSPWILRWHKRLIINNWKLDTNQNTLKYGNAAVWVKVAQVYFLEMGSGIKIGPPPSLLCHTD